MPSRQPRGGAWGGSPFGGYPVGIVTLETRHPLIPGNVQHAGSFGFPVLYRGVRLDDDPFALMRGDGALAPRIIEAARDLENQGVAVIAGACGSFAYYQDAVRDAVDIPVFMSVMLQAPLLLAGLPGHRRLLVLCAKASAITDRVLADCGVRDQSRLVIQQVAGRPAFDAMLAGVESMDVEAFEAEVLAAADEAVARAPDIGAVLLQCSDLPPTAVALQARLGLPVFDAVLMIRWLAAAADYRPHAGYMRRNGPRHGQ